MNEETCKLLQGYKEKWLASDKQCTDCIWYVAKYRDDYTLRHFGYGEVKIRPACRFCGSYSYVSHNPAALCKHYYERKE